MKRSLLLAVLIGLCACGTNASQIAIQDAGGPDCSHCAQGEVCFQSQCCAPKCEGRQCGDDSCGGDCGTCEQGWTCNAGTGKCECPAETDEAFCARMNVVCGKATGKDACGQDREVACDRCTSGKRCDQASSTCTCPETDAQLCARLGKDCGALAAATDSCGDARAVASCGTCGAGELCDTAANTCELCTPQLDPDFCAANGKQCGSFTAEDPCSQLSRTPTCPECQPGFDCDAANQCNACAPETKDAFCQRLGKNCGGVTAPDRCRLEQTFDCGTCSGTDFCGDDNTCHACVPEPNSVLCANHGMQCGALAATDNCGVARTVAECGPCTGPLEHCDATGTCAVCLPESDSELCAFYYKNCGSPQLLDRCGQTRTPACGTACPAGLSCQTNGVCGNGTTPTNDTCASPERLVLDATGTATASGDLTPASPDYRGSCGGSGHDVVYVLTLTQQANLAVTVAAGNSSIWTEVYIRTSCTSVADIACGYGPTQGTDAHVSVRGLTPGDYFIILDGYYGNNGPFTLTVTATTPPPAPANDTCAAPQQLVFVGNTATTTGDTTSAINDYNDTCSSSALSGPDVVYKMTLTADSAVTVKVTPDASATGYYPAVEILSSCPGTGTALACATNSNGLAKTGKGALPAGDYYLIVDGTSNSAGSFTLEVTTAPPFYNDLCPSATDVPLVAVAGSSDLVGTVAGDTSIAADDYTSSCNPSSGGQDVVFKFTTTAEHSVRIDLASSVEPNLYVRTDCLPNGVEKGCLYSSHAGTPVSLPLKRLAAGTYYVFVDGLYGFSNGPFSLTITASAPPPPVVNDSCANPTALTLTNGLGHLEDSTGPAGDDFVGSCATGNYPFSGADVTYRVTAPSFGYLAAKVHRKATSPSYEPAVYIQSTCGDPTTDKACGYDAYNGAAQATTTALAAGTYYIVVDGVGGTFGDFTLDVSFYTNAGPDSCSGAKLLAFDLNGDAADVGDSCQLSNDSTNDAALGCPWANSGYGNDAVYKLVTTGAKNLTVAFNPGQSWSSYVYVQTTCGSPSTQVNCNEATNSATNVLPMKNLAAGTYYIWVDNSYANCGAYDVHFHLSDPPAAPANDACTGAQVIAIDTVTGIGTITGTTDSAADDTAGSCSGSAVGPEVFFSFALPGTRTVDIKVTPDVGSVLKPVIYAQTACGSAASEIQCNAAALTGSGQTAELQWPRLGQGTYYLVVDSYDRNATGPFTVTITTSAVGSAAANDVCATPLAMPAIDPATHKTSITGDTVDGNNDETSYCANSSTAFTGADLFYTFVLPSDAVVTAKVTSQAGNPAAYKPALSLRKTCGLSGEVACGNDSPTSPAGLAQVTRALAAGTWYVVVDGLDSSFGPFELEVTQGAPAAAGDTCGNPIALTFALGTATASGDLLAGGLGDEYAPTTCENNYAQSPDQVYTFTTTTEKFATVSIGPGATGGTMINPFVYLRTACNDATSEIACAHTNTNGGSTSFNTTRLPAGTYYVIVDASSSYYSGSYVLTVTLVDAIDPPPANDSCSSATSVVLTNHVAHYTGDTSNAVDDYGGTGTCGAATSTAVGRLAGGDVVYSVAVTAGSTLTAVVTADASTRSYVPAVYLRSHCASAAPSDQLACDYQTSTSYRLAGVSATNLAAGTYYIIVDGKGGTSGLFALDVYVRPTAVANTSCSAAEPIAFDTTSVPGQATASIVGDTNLGASNTQGVQQGPQYCYSSGKELYYSFTTTAVQDLVVLNTPLNGSYGPVVYLRSDCADPASQLACDFNYGGSLLNVTKLKLPAGPYTLVVDSPWAGASGPFSLQITLSDPPPPPANDACRGATVLTLPASGGATLIVSDSTTPAVNDYVGGCQTASNPFDGPDVVYRFTPTTNTQVTALVVAKPNSRLKAALYLRSTCATTTDDVCAYNSSAGSSSGATVVASVKSGTTYYLIVDGIAGTAGDYDLTLTVDDTKYLAGDECTNPISLDALFAANPTNPAEMIATVSGDTTTATNSSDGACNWSSGGELVYAFTLTQASVVGVTVGPSGTASSYAPEFYIRTTCGDPVTEFYCAYNGSNTPKSAQLTRLPPGLYYLFVDSSSSGSVGPFTLSVAVKPPPATTALNDTCAGATPLSFTPSMGTPQVATLASEDSSWASDDAQGSCYQSHGGDLVYTFTTTSPKSFSAVVTPASGQTLFKPVVYLRNVCNQSADTAELGCTKQTAGGSAGTLILNSIPAGTYWLYVDNYLSNQWDPPGGQYSLSVTLDAVATPAPPANDHCTGAQQITLTGQAPSVTTVTGQTTIGATADGFGSGGSCSSDSGMMGADVVYYFDLTSPAKVDAKATFTTIGSPMPNPVVYIRTSCGSGGTVACNYTTSANNVTATAAYLPAGRYYLWVDGSNATGSDFKLDLTLTTPTAPPPPSNFLCSGTLPALTKGVPVTGTTIGSQNTNAVLNEACGSDWAAGPNAVYTYTPTQDEFFLVAMTCNSLAPNSWDMLVWMSDRCLDGQSCLAYNNSASGPGTTDSFRYYGKAGVTYYIVVDASSSGNAGTFTLTVH